MADHACLCADSVRAAAAQSNPPANPSTTQNASCSCKKFNKPPASRGSHQLEAESIYETPSKSLNGAARLQQLKGGAKARELFFRELLGELDRAYRSSKVFVSKPLPAADGGMLIQLRSRFQVVSPSNEADHIGAYYVYWNDEKTLKKERKEIQAKLDQFIIDNAALTPSEIQALTQGLKPPAHY